MQTNSSTRNSGFTDILHSAGPNLPPWDKANFTQKITILFYKSIVLTPAILTISYTFLSFIIYLLYYITPTYGLSLLPPFYRYSASYSQDTQSGLIELTAMTICIILTLISLFRTIFTDPGTIPQTNEWIINNKSSIQIRKKDGIAKICYTCNVIKPERCHHCSLCDRCIQKLDHHCPWVANCIGDHNYKFFFLCLTYGTIALSIYIFTFWGALTQIMNKQDHHPVTSFLLLVHYSTSSMLWMILAIYWAFNAYLILGNFTTIEYCEKRKRYSQYSRGLIHNIQEALGPISLIALPVGRIQIDFKYEPTEGLSFKTSCQEDVEQSYQIIKVQNYSKFLSFFNTLPSNPATFLHSSIAVIHHTIPMSEISLELSFVPAAIIPGMNTKPMHFSLFPLAKILAFVISYKPSNTLHSIIFPTTYIDIPVFLMVLSNSFLQVGFKPSCIPRSICPALTSQSAFLILYPFPFVNIPIATYQFSNPVLFTIHHLSNINTIV